MCKLAFAKTKNGTAFKLVLKMLEHQENVQAGQSTGIAWLTNSHSKARRAMGKVADFKKMFPEIPVTNMALGHSRYASIGSISIENAHPIRIFVNGKKIGYGAHNGTWSRYKDYDYLRNPELKNKTDSALMFTIYGKILEKYGDTAENRRRAIVALNRIMASVPEATQNLIFMFNDGQVLFVGNTLTYHKSDNYLGIMTFGFENHVEVDKVYEVRGEEFVFYKPQDFTDFVPERRPPATPIFDFRICDDGEDIALCPREEPEEIPDFAQRTLESYGFDKEKKEEEAYRVIEGKKYILFDIFNDKVSAQIFAKRLRDRVLKDHNEFLRYAVVTDYSDKKPRLFVENKEITRLLRELHRNRGRM